ncbi:MAG: arsenate reductase ArsC [Nitrososphaeria archaeon]|jgi:protein-tyrosine-phosphatase
MQKKKMVLFICVGNSGRSQMAEGFFNSMSPESYYAVSAGTKPAREVNSLVVEVMRERGIDISGNKPKALESWMYTDAEKIILMGCDEDACPAPVRGKVEKWQVDDVRGKPIEDIRRVRDNVEGKVKILLNQLKALR